jgi:hypothetical protein
MTECCTRRQPLKFRKEALLNPGASRQWRDPRWKRLLDASLHIGTVAEETQSLEFLIDLSKISTQKMMSSTKR